MQHHDKKEMAGANNPRWRGFAIRARLQKISARP